MFWWYCMARPLGLPPRVAWGTMSRLPGSSSTDTNFPEEDSHRRRFNSVDTGRKRNTIMHTQEGPRQCQRSETITDPSWAACPLWLLWRSRRRSPFLCWSATAGSINNGQLLHTTDCRWELDTESVMSSIENGLRPRSTKCSQFSHAFLQYRRRHVGDRQRQ